MTARNVAIMIPQGAIIEIVGGPFNGIRLMDVRYEGEMIMMLLTTCRSTLKQSRAPPHTEPGGRSRHPYPPKAKIGLVVFLVNQYSGRTGARKEAKILGYADRRGNRRSIP